MTCRRDPALMLSIFFAALSFGLLTISYSKIFIECPLLKLTHLVNRHSDEIDNLTKVVKAHFTTEAAQQITSFYEEMSDGKR